MRLYDRYLLCSDGVHGGVPDRLLAEILARRSAPQEAARDLVDAGLRLAHRRQRHRGW